MTTASSSVIPSGASGSGMLGRLSASSPSSASTCSSSSLPVSIVSFRPATVAISCSASASSPCLFALADLLRERLALRLGVLDLGQQLAAAGVQRQQLVDPLGRAAPRQRRLDPLGIGADRFRSSMGRPRYGVAVSPGRGDCSASEPAYLATNSATSFGLFADDDVLGHDRAGEAAVLDREEGVVVGLFALVEVRALGPLAAVAAALGAGGAERVAAGAVGREEDRAVVVGVAPWRPRSLPRRSRRPRARGRRPRPFR